MTFSLDLPDFLKKQGWKVKIRNNERVEEPHVSILRRTKTWRWGLRSNAFLDPSPPPREVPGEILKRIARDLDLLIDEWDRRYPENKVHSKDEM